MTMFVLLAAYASYLVEIVVFPVPSIASTYQLVFTGKAQGSPGDAIRRSRSKPFRERLLFFVLPTVACIVFFLAPLSARIVPSARSALGPIPSLENDFMTLLGLFAIALGRALTFSSVLSMRGGWGHAFRPVTPESLRANQLFSRSRNPGLVGMFVFYLGLVAVTPSIFMLIGIPVYFGSMHFKVLLEESDLEGRFGSGFLEYKGLTRRYL